MSVTAPRPAERSRPHVIAEITRIRAILEAHVDGASPPATAPPATSRRRERLAGPFDQLAQRLGLSAFERDILALAAAVELDCQVGALVARLQGATDPRPTFGLALAVLPDPHWDALSPDRPLRRWQLLEPGPGPTLATRPLSIDEHVLHLLTGLTSGDGALTGWVRPTGPTTLTPVQCRLGDDLLRAVTAISGKVLVRLDGDDPDARIGVAERLAAGLGQTVLLLREDTIVDPAELAQLARYVDRTALLQDRLPVVGTGRLADFLDAPIVVATGEGAGLPGRTLLRRTVSLPGPAEQRSLWDDALRDGSPASTAAVTATAGELAAHYRLPAATVHAVAAEWRAAAGEADADAAADLLRRLTRDRARVGLEGLADRIDLRATRDDLVLPDGQLMLLRDLATHVRYRTHVYERWGFADRANRGLGVTALFAGESGTGKTMAAEVVAGELGLDLYRIDLSSVVSKYIGETEKNLRRLFDAAEGSGAVLLFDEADALFSKRGEVRDSHDRYANVEVAYLLQRMESYRGLAVLTTNLRSNIDRAFLRRLRFVIQFPFPDETLREQIWRRSFPPRTPTEGLDPAALARMQVCGGSIRTIALGAAFAAAQAGTPIRPGHILHAARVEYAKAERPLTDAETAGIEARS